MRGVRRGRRAFASLACIVVAAAVALAAASPASATPTKKAPETLTALWTKVLTTPDADNPFGSGGIAKACWDLDGTLAPFGPFPPDAVPSCTARPGTPLFLIGSSFECSTFENNGTTEAELRACARAADLQTAPSITFDGRPLAVAEVETPLMTLTLPAGNLFGLPAGTTGTSVGHGWVTQVNPRPPGTHTVVITGGPSPITTTIVVSSH